MELVLIIFNGEDVEIKNWLGKFGAYTAHRFLKVWYGIASFAFPFIGFLIGFKALFKQDLLPFVKTLKVTLITMIWLCITMSFIFQNTNLDFIGGMYGKVIIDYLQGVFNVVGTAFFILFFGFTAIVLLFNPSLSWIIDFFNSISAKLNTLKNRVPFTVEEAITQVSTINTPTDRNNVSLAEEMEVSFDKGSKDEIVEVENDVDQESKITDQIDDDKKIIANHSEEKKLDNQDEDDFSVEVAVNEEELSKSELKDKLKEFGEYDPKLDLSKYVLPNIDLMENHGDGQISVNKDELEANKNRIIETLQNYKINISKIKATIGPTVTLYEIIPAPGVRISKIKNLEDDIALSLSALGIRIIAPMPGKGTVGIEVPNSKPDIVAMKSLIASKNFRTVIWSYLSH